MLKGSVSISVPFTPEQIGQMSSKEFAKNEKEIMSQLQRGLINPIQRDYSNYTNPISGDTKIYSREDIGTLRGDEYAKLEKEINAQLNSIGIPTQNELKSSGGTVFVNGYTRDDGTEVKSYYRSAPNR